MPIFAYEKSVKCWGKFKDFEIRTPFSGVGDPRSIAYEISKVQD